MCNVMQSTALFIYMQHFFLVLPRVCLYACMCYYSLLNKLNTFQCDGKGLNKLPEIVPNKTESLLLSGNDFLRIQTPKYYFHELLRLNLSSSGITHISDSVIDALINSINIFDISNNELKTLPRKITDMTDRTVLKLKGNPFDCVCNMMWMKDWLLRTNNVVDKNNVTCSMGKMKGCSLNLYLIIFSKIFVKFNCYEKVKYNII